MHIRHMADTNISINLISMKYSMRYLPEMVILIFLGCSQPQDPEISKEYYELAIEEIRNDQFEKVTALFRKAMEFDSTNTLLNLMIHGFGTLKLQKNNSE